MRTAFRTLPILASLLSIAGIALTSCKPQPARLVVGRSDTMVVNNTGRALLAVEVVDREGRPLASSDVKYEWISGDPVELTAQGRIKCLRRGDAELRASLGTLSTRIVLLCRPIEAVGASLSGLLVVGGPPRDLELSARGADHQVVTLIAARAKVLDTNIAALRGLQVFPKVPGRTRLEVELGDCLTYVDLVVDERVDSANGLRPYQQFVVAPLHVVPGEIRTWRIPRGNYDISLRTDSTSHAELLLGAIKTQCLTSHADRVRHYYYCIALEGASVVVRHPQPAGKGRAMSGQLVVRRMVDPESARREVPRKPTRVAETRKPMCTQLMFAGL